MENVNPYIPATKKDAEHLKRMRARVWPQFWLCVVILVAIITTCWIHFGWIQTLVGCIVVFVIGFGVPRRLRHEARLLGGRSEAMRGGAAGP